MGSLLVSVTPIQCVNIWAKPPSSSLRMSFMDGVLSLYYLVVHASEGIMRRHQQCCVDTKLIEGAGRDAKLALTWAPN